ncbi:MAG: TM0106 family RecB-like putative nuclease [Propionibacteriaceae bacterium]
MTKIVLDASAAYSCPVKVQNTFHPLISDPGPRTIDDGLADIFARSHEHENTVISALLAGFTGSICDLRSLSDQSWEAKESACLAAMAEGVEIILGGALPQDLAGHRSGRPTWWQRTGVTETGMPGYSPVKIKNHAVLERRQSGKDVIHEMMCSPVTTPGQETSLIIPDRVFRSTSRENDLLQAAHYRKLLEAHRYADATTAWAGIVGNETDANGVPLIVWVDLAEKTIRTFSRTAADGWKLRSPLERYDHEHGFRVRVAQVASQQQADSTSCPPLMVAPIAIRECSSCRWWENCQLQLPPEDLSLRIDKTPLDVREISALRALKIFTVSDLAKADVETLLTAYLPQVTHRSGTEGRLRLAARRARLLTAGIALEREGDSPIVVPSAAVEIDFDIETSSDDRVYLWGFQIRGGAEQGVPQGFIPFVEFTDLDDQAETALAVKAMQWLRTLAEAGHDIRVYHYSDYEVVRLQRLANRNNSPDLLWAVEWAREHFVDLFAIVKRNFFGTHGLGLKVVAHEGPGFEWRDEDPGGLNSQSWFTEAVHGETADIRNAAAQRVLEYNEDDVRATVALRDWLAIYS